MEDVRLSFPFIEGMDSTSHPVMADNSTLQTDTQNMFMQKAETYMAFRVVHILLITGFLYWHH